MQAQNLVPNASFEAYDTCPEDYSQHYYEPYVKYWDSPNAGTPDYFNSCSYKCGVPLNWVGSAEAAHGSAYMGIIGCMQQLDSKQIAYREYLRIKLSDTLEQGVEYYASMKVRLGLSCSISCNGMGMYFSPVALSTNRKINYPMVAQITEENNAILNDKKAWTQICGSFVAEGNEVFLIIGNFLSNQQMQFIQLDENLIETQHTTPSAYYFIDDVKVNKYVDSLDYACEALYGKMPLAFNGDLKKNSNLILENLHFEVDRAVILKESYYELDELVYEMKRKANLKIRIHGHTDNTGNAAHNLDLSEKRALAVRNYLLEKGVSKFRMVTKGFGDSQPISENTTEEGKQMNRRVEIEVY